MTPRDYWQHYVERIGGPAKVAAHLGIPYSTIAGVCNGSRGIGRRLANRMKAADSLLDESQLVFVARLPKPADDSQGKAA